MQPTRSLRAADACRSAVTRFFAWSSKLRKGRMEAFGDGVVAIFITIMVLELTVPRAVGEVAADAASAAW